MSDKKKPGRPPVIKSARYVTIYLSDADAHKLKRLGGTRWVRKKLAEEPEIVRKQFKNGTK